MNILFIDDDVDDTALFCEAVDYLNKSEILTANRIKINCTTANNGCTAIEHLPALDKFPDLIYLDVNMPVMGGKECLAYLKQGEYSSVPVVMLSTALMPHQVSEFKALGAVDCLIKPNSFNELVKVLSKHIYKILL